MGAIEVVHRERGIFLPGAELWLDSRPGRGRGFVSHAHSDHFGRHEWTLCSPATLRLMECRYGSGAAGDAVTPGWGEPVVSGGYEYRLLPAGHVLGSAMLHVTRRTDGATLLYTGDFKLRRGLTAEPAELVPAGTLVMETTFGRPEFRFPPAEEVTAAIRKFVIEAVEDGDVPVLAGYSLGKAQELLAVLRGAGVPVMLHRTMTALTRVYEAHGGGAGAAFLEWRPFQADAAAGHVVIVPPSAMRSRELRRLKRIRTAIATGWAMVSGARFRYQVDEAFPLSDHADYGELMECVRQVQPEAVFTVHGYCGEFARDLRAAGYNAWSLAGNDQLELALTGEPAPGVTGGGRAIAVESAEPGPAGGSPDDLPADSFALWAATCESVSAESSRLRKQELLAAYLVRVPERDLPRAVRWLTANLADPAMQAAPLQTGWATIRQGLMAATGMRETEFRRLSRSQNDSGRTAFLALQGRADALRPRGMSLEDVDSILAALRAARGPAAKVAILRDAWLRMSPLEGSYLTRLLTGELRIGSREGLVEEAVALAFSQPAGDLREAIMLCGDVGRAAALAKDGRLAEARPELFVPVRVMLASPEETAEAVWERLGAGGAPDGVWLEDKYDGIRAQVHASGSRVEIYTRDLKAVGSQFPEIVQAGAELSGELIVDGEIIAHAEDRRLTFHDLQRRLGRRDQADLFLCSDIFVRYVVFDLLLLNGRSLIHEPLAVRRRLLESLTLPAGWERIDVRYADSPEAIEAAFHAARRAGNEGLIAKDGGSLYAPGRRGKHWLKLKKAFSTLDVVVVRAEQGHGRRSHVLSDYTFAVRDDAGALRVIGKAYSGLTDAEIEELTAHFSERTVSRRGNVRTVSPDVVLEVAFDSIRPSSRHDSGLALRFPRIRAIRRDKGVADIDTLGYARALAGLPAE